MYKGYEALVCTRACHTSCVISFTLLKNWYVDNFFCPIWWSLICNKGYKLVFFGEETETPRRSRIWSLNHWCVVIWYFLVFADLKNQRTSGFIFWNFWELKNLFNFAYFKFKDQGSLCRNPTFREVWGRHSHSQKWDLRVLQDFQKFRTQLQGSKHLALRCFYYCWKVLEA
jgi:hypothetical protein